MRNSQILHMKEWTLPCRGASWPRDLFVVSGGRHQVSSRYRKEHHPASLSALVYVLSGRGCVSYLGRQFSAGPDSIFAIIHGNDVTYWTDHSDPWLFLWVSFGGRRAPTLLKRAGLTPSNPVLRSPTLFGLRSHFLELHRLGNAKTSGASSSALGKLWMLFGALIDRQAQERNQDAAEPSKEFDLTARVSRYLSEHLSEPITLEHLSRAFHRSPCSLARHFQNQMAQSTIDYLIDLRIHQAQHMLLEEALSVAEIAHAVAYDDPAYFSRLFKKRTGISPLQYRQHHAGPSLRRSRSR